MSTGTDFLANLQKKTVKNTVQQKQQKRVNASAVDVSALLEAALGKKKPVEAVADVRQSTDAATASFLPLADTHQGRSTQQKPKNASDKKQTPQKSKDMAVPFRRTSKTKKRMRRTHLKKEVGDRKSTRLNSSHSV